MEGAKQLSLIVRFVAGLMLLFALGEHSYSYYQLLRIVVCGASIFLVWYFIQAKMEWLGWFFIIPAILFNPMLPIYMDKSAWQFWDLIFGVVFLATLSTHGRERQIK